MGIIETTPNYPKKVPATILTWLERHVKLELSNSVVYYSTSNRSGGIQIYLPGSSNVTQLAQSGTQANFGSFNGQLLASGKVA
jgi:hypothetical protein